MWFIALIFFKTVHMHCQTAASLNINRLSDANLFVPYRSRSPLFLEQTILYGLAEIKECHLPMVFAFPTCSSRAFPYESQASRMGWYQGATGDRRTTLTWPAHETAGQALYLVPEGMSTLSCLQGGCNKLLWVPPLLLSMWILSLR